MSLTVAPKDDRKKKKLEERLQPTLEAAVREMVDTEKTVSAVERKLMAARVMHIAFTLSVIAIEVSWIITRQLSDGAAFAILALCILMALLMFYDYQVCKSGEPETSRGRVLALKTFILVVEAFIRECGGCVVAGPEMEAAVAECEWRFGQIMGATSEAAAVEGEMEVEYREAR